MSAHSLARFVMCADGMELIRARVWAVLDNAVRFDKAIPQRETRFDAYGKGRFHDLGIFGETGNRSVFVGVKAKVDERFGKLVGEAYLSAIAHRIGGNNTRAPKRIEQLPDRHFPSPAVSMFDIRYQLLYSTAGTLAEKADLSVLYVIVFRTPLYDEVKGAENYLDYVRFMDSIGAERSKSGVVLKHTAALDNRALHCIYGYTDA